MSDPRITQLTKLNQADVAANDVLPIVDVGSSTTKKVEAKDLFQAGANLADNGSIDLAKLNQSSATKLGASALADDAVSARSLADDSSIAYDSIAPVADNFQGRGYVDSNTKRLQVYDGTAFQQVMTPEAGIEAGAVTNSKLGAGAVTTDKVSALGTAAYADSSVTNAKLAGGITANKLAGGITTSLIDASGLGAAALASNAVTTEKVQDAAITATKLANDSTTIVQAGTPSGSGAFEGQHWFDTNTSVEYVWNGAAWIRQAAINTITFSDSTPLTFSVAYPDQYSATITTALDTQQANRVFIGPASGADAAPTFRALTPGDLPVATSVTAGISQPGTGLIMNGNVLNHSNSVVGGTYTKVTIDAQGHVSAGALIEAADVPNLDASKITSGTFATARLADNSVTIDKMADYSTASLSETFPAPSFIGQIHLNPLDKSFFMWDGNVWVPIGISAGQIVLAGTFDASSPAGIGEVESVTPEGAAAGFVAGSALPPSTATNNRFYFVVSQGGTITSGNAPNVALAPPDIILSIYNTSGAAWVEVDVSAGAGAISANQVSFVPGGAIGSSNVQSAIEEVSTECRNADNLSSGTVAVARGGTGTGSYTKGDVLAATGATALGKLGVGTNGQVLTADSAETTGLKWSTPTTGTVTNVTSSSAALTVATGTTTPALTLRSATTSVNGIVQLSDSINTTSSTLAATSTAVKSAYDLANAAMPKAGGTFTGDITMGANVGIQFEGTTDDANETRLVAADPTADRTITLPNATGTLVLSGAIVNADVNASAAIAHSKLASMTAGSVLLGNASNVPTSTAITGDVTLSSTGVTAIAAGAVVNADINASAAIAGTKISPNFGSQNIITTGSAAVGLSSGSRTLSVGSASNDEGIEIRNTSTAASTSKSSRVQFTGTDTVGTVKEAANIYCIPDDQDYVGAHLSLRTRTGNSVAQGVRISGDGKVHLDTGSFGSAQLNVRERISATIVSHFDSTQAQGTGWFSLYNTSSSNTVVQSWIRGDGTYGSRANVYGATSDIKLKENIADAGSQWDDIKAIEVKNFNLIGDDKRQLGVIAQQVEEVSPGLVDETVDLDEQGQELGTTTKIVKYSVLYMKAVKALQEAMERIEDLESRLTAAGI